VHGVTYYAVAYAVNIKGVSYGSELSFLTETVNPVVYTALVTRRYPTSAFVGGTVSSDGGNTVTSRGVFLSSQPNAVVNGLKIEIGTGKGVFSDSVVGLIPGSTYYVTAFAVNNAGTGYGEERTFTTQGALPEAVTLYAKDVTTSGAKLWAIVNGQYLDTEVSFEYGTTTQYGITVQAGQITGQNTADTLFATIGALLPNTIYYFRVRAQNSLGVATGGDSIFTTVLDGITGLITDASGNNYVTIGIGHQTWMAQNLRTTKYNDASDIALEEADSVWQQLTTGAYCWYNNNNDYSANYGALYNWYSVNTGKLCPAGWHVPTEDDFNKLVDYLSGSGTAGGLLKQTGFTYWNNPNKGATNQYGFNGYGGGMRDKEAVYDFMKTTGNWWSASQYSTLTSSYFSLHYQYTNTFQNYLNKKTGLSVRCVKND
jgi:uncharacterized protein (TIGR02145 family)